MNIESFSLKSKNLFLRLVAIIIVGNLLISCSKDSDPIPAPVVKKPKLGTTWTYQYYTFYSYGGGGIATSEILNYKAKTEEIIGGEKWLKIVNVKTDTTVYLLQEKVDGLYQNINNTSYLLCKYPASLNESYNTFNAGASEAFVVKGVQDSLETGVGKVPVNFYEGTKSGYIIDEIWYNENAWIVKHQVYRVLMGPNYYKYSRLSIESIAY